MSTGRSEKAAARRAKIPPALKIAVALGNLAAVIFTISLFMYFSANQLDTDRRRVAHTLDVRAAIASALVSIMDAESQQRSYLLTGDETYRRGYLVARADLFDRVARTRRLTRDDPKQQQRLSLMDSLIRQKIAFLDELIARHGAGPPDRDIDLSRGHRLLMAIRNLMAIIDADERGMYAERFAAETRTLAAVKTGLFAWAGINIMILLAITVAVVKAWQLSRRMEAETGMPLPGESPR
jgi:CHASE3 domain sensor protein